jgi:glucose-6-phosphate 1-dehydrogenase
MSSATAPPPAAPSVSEQRASRPAEEQFAPGMRAAQVPPPLALVIFGATGDLTRRKLIPALFNLFCEGLLPERFAVLGVSRSEWSDEQFRREMKDAVVEFVREPDEEAWDRFAPALRYEDLDFGDSDGYERLRERLDELDSERGTDGNRLFYLAIPPGVIARVADGLGDAGMARTWKRGWSRLIVEKPFGRDLASAEELNAELLRVFREAQLFRIDHYLGKETTQNLLVFRFANVIWEPVWNRNFVDHVEITVAESNGIGSRAGYFDRAGVLRDMVQSHLLQLLSLVAMEPPSAYDADGIRNEKEKVLRAVRPICADDVATETVRGVYTAGEVDGEAVVGYRDEEDVPDDSATETYAALRLWIDNWRWAGVPFYLRTGKRLPAKRTEIAVRFRAPPHPVLDAVEHDQPEQNLLVLRIQPEEGISLFFEAKVPGLRGPLRPVSMDFGYCDEFGVDSPEAYQRLLLDAMLGDATLFARRDEVEAAWRLVTPILEGWAAGGEPEPYPAGSWGPQGAETLIRRDCRGWHTP